jgi:predicted DNA-binding protein with PD1-like motif
LRDAAEVLMMMSRQVTAGSIFMGRLCRGCDLLDGLTKAALDCGARLGRIEAIGAVERACIGCYDQDARSYLLIPIERPMEIANLTGNVSLKDGVPFVHAHVTLTDSSGRACGGHLAAGTVVFACEFVLAAFEGDDLVRLPDGETGLSLWPIP